MCESNHALIRVYYTGGTIGMKKNAANLPAPVPNIMESVIKNYPDLYDEEYTQKMQKCQCANGSIAVLAMPMIEGLNKRVLYSIVEYAPLLDSSNMDMDDWIRIAKDIEREYDLFNGFVILHGTDTLSYTASALSFMLENLGKPVILTGAQISIFDCRNDARNNFVSALAMAGNYDIPEVCVAFGRKLYRGNRTIKRSLRDFQAFDSPNYPPLADLAANIKVILAQPLSIIAQAILPKPTEKFHAHTKLCCGIDMIRIFPGINVETVCALLAEPTRGVVLQSYGEGTAPCNRQDLVDAWTEATDRGVIIVNTTQCLEGAVKEVPRFNTSVILQESGIISGSDMTPEAALCKLSYVLSKSEWDCKTKKQKLRENLCGELTVQDVDEEPAAKKDYRTITNVAELVSFILDRGCEGIKIIESQLYPALIRAAIVEENLCHLKQLHKKGIDVTGIANVYDEQTALHIACIVGADSIVEFLMDNGADINAYDKRCHTPLLDAIENEHKAIVCMLVQAGAHLSCSKTIIANSIVSAIDRGCLGVLQCFHAAGVNLSTLKDLTGRTPAHVAAILKQQEILEYLLCLGHGSESTKDDLGLTPVDYIELMRQQASVCHCEEDETS